jgi:hypothetical protein
MALSNYSDLQETALDVIGRTGDTSLTAYAPVAIALVEAKLNRNLRVSEMEDTATLTGTGGDYALPDDFADWRQVRIASYAPLEYVTPDWASDTYPTGGSGIPRFFTIKGSTLTVFPASSSSVILDYYQKIPPLSDSLPSNWLLGSHPDVYLFMTLSELCTYTKDPEAALLWNQRGMTAVEEVRTADRIKRYSRVTARVKGPTP